MSNIYTKERHATQSISVLSSIDVERAKRRREKIERRHAHALERKILRETKKVAKRVIYPPMPIDIDVLILSGSWDYANASYLYTEALRSVGIKAMALVRRKPSGGYPQTGDYVPTVIEIRKYALRSKIIQFMHSRFVSVPMKGKHVVVFHGGTRYRQKAGLINKQFNSIVDKSIIQTQDLWNLGAKNPVWVLPPVDVKKLQPVFNSSRDKRIIAHYPHKATVKGSLLINEVIATLSNDSALKDKFEYRYQESSNIPWLDYLKMIKECDIYIEACAPTQRRTKYGEWGITALEAAALGKVVVTHFLSQDEYPREYGPCSLVVANNAKEMEKGLRRLILMSEDELLALRKQTRAWVEKYHSFEAVGNRLKEKVYGDWL